MKTLAVRVADLLDQHYRADRLHRGPGTRARLVADRLADLTRFGCTYISRHDSVTRATIEIALDGDQLTVTLFQD